MATSPPEPTSTGRPAGVIHDIGYRSWTGPVESTGRIALHLYLTALRHAYGLGRSGRSKALPMLLAVLTLLPAAVMVGILAILDGDEQLLTPFGYTHAVQVLVSIFAAAQAPVIFSRDLRSRSIVLYLARPLGAGVFAVVRWLALATAVLLFVLVPQVVLYAGGQLAGLDTSAETLALAKALPLDLVTAALLAAVTGLVASVALRRGFAVVASILVLVLLDTVVTSIQFVALDNDIPRFGEVAGLLSPWSLVNGLAAAADAGVQVVTPPEGAAMVSLYVLVALAVVAGCLLALVRRFRKAGR